MRLAAGLVRAAVGRLHDPGAAAGADDEAVPRRLERQAPARRALCASSRASS